MALTSSAISWASLKDGRLHLETSGAAEAPVDPVGLNLISGWKGWFIAIVGGTGAAGAVDAVGAVGAVAAAVVCRKGLRCLAGRNPTISPASTYQRAALPVGSPFLTTPTMRPELAAKSSGSLMSQRPITMNK